MTRAGRWTRVTLVFHFSAVVPLAFGFALAVAGYNVLWAGLLAGAGISILVVPGLILAQVLDGIEKESA